MERPSEPGYYLLNGPKWNCAVELTKHRDGDVGEYIMVMGDGRVFALDSISEDCTWTRLVPEPAPVDDAGVERAIAWAEQTSYGAILAAAYRRLAAKPGPVMAVPLTDDQIEAVVHVRLAHYLLDFADRPPEDEDTPEKDQARAMCNELGAWLIAYDPKDELAEDAFALSKSLSARKFVPIACEDIYKATEVLREHEAKTLASRLAREGFGRIEG